MKRVFIFLLLVFCYGTNSFGIDSRSNEIFIDTPAVIKKIQTDFLTINKKLSRYKKKSREAFGLSAEGGVITGYYDKTSLKKIHGIFYGEMGKTEADYYFNGKGLFFIYKKEVFYDKPMYLKDFKVKGAIETRYYINAKKIIKSISKPAGSAVLAYKDMAQEVKQLVNILNSK